MNQAIKNMIETRTSVSKFIKHEIDEHEIEEMVRLASLSPSAYNLQNWKFIAVKSHEKKIRLQHAAYGQAQVVDASVAFIICGELESYLELDSTLALSVSRGIMPAHIAHAWVNAANDSHENNPALQRDEAIRSASLASMTLMYAAQSMGYASGAMGGFDAAEVKRAFNLNDQEIPVMLVVIGKPKATNWVQKVRKPVEYILRVE